MLELRPYQSEALDAVAEFWNRGGGNPLVEMATGTGKSVVIAQLVRELIERYPDIRVLMLVHVRELVAQNAQALLRAWPQAPLGINSASLNKRDTDSQVLFCSIQSVFRQAKDLGARDLVIIDEVHLVPRSGEGMYLTLLDGLRAEVPDLRICGFTATPYRLDSGRLDSGDGKLFDEICYSYRLGQAVKDGWLAPLISKATSTEIDVKGVARRGDFVIGQLEKAAQNADVINAACDEIVKLGADRKSWLVFCCGVQHAYSVRDALRARDVTAETITAETSMGERDLIFSRFKAGGIRALTGMNVFTTGFDAPSVDLIASLRPTLSTGLYVQMAGRGTRLAEGKANCLYLSYDGNVRRHGPVDDVSIRNAPLKGKAANDNEEKITPDTVRAKICPECTAYVAIAAQSCPYCEYQWPKPEPKHAARAEVVQVMSIGERLWLPVDGVSYHYHESHRGTASMRVGYRCAFVDYSEWVCVEHKGFPRAKAEAWWRAFGGGKLPAYIRDALQLTDTLTKPLAIKVRREGRYYRVTDYKIQRADGRIWTLDERLTPRPCLEVKAA